MRLNQVVFTQSTNTINKNSSTGYTREVVSKPKKLKTRCSEASEHQNMLVAYNPRVGGGAQEEIKQ
jgi:hypothetical protein